MTNANARTHVVSLEPAALLRTHGLKATSQRVAILRVLQRAHAPLALHEIQERLSQGTANQSTLYRAMQDLSEAGLVRSVNLRHNHAHYELALGEDHHHLVCTTCGRVEDYTSPLCEKIEREALKQSTSFASVSDHAFDLYGTCKKCVTA